MDIGFAYAFVGGVLGAFSPCSALLLPAVVAQTATTGLKVVVFASCFLGGLLVTLVPLGVGVGALSNAVNIDRGALITVGAVVVIGLGVFQLFGGGLNFGSKLPGVQRSAGSVVGAFLLGSVAGVGSFCTGPVLGAILTMIATGKSPVTGGLTMVVYGVGTMLPIVGLALGIKKLGARRVSWVRGRTISFGPFHGHTWTFVTAGITIVVGVAMLVTGGLTTSSGFVPQSVDEAILWCGQKIDDVVPPWVWFGAAIVALFGWQAALVRRMMRS